MTRDPRSAASAPRGRLVELDALRGLAAVAVMLYHFTTLHARETGFAGRPSWNVWWGDNGVEVFFVISGFVIFMTLEHTKRPMDFIVSRFSRLYPAYWAAILFTTIVVQLLDVGAFARSRQEVAMNLTMLQRLPGLDVRDVDWSYWSLYTELLFYVAMLVLFATGQLKRIEAWLIAALCAALAFRGFELIAPDHGRLAVGAVSSFKGVIPFAPLFVIGICLYRWWSGARPNAAGVLIVASLATIGATLSAEQFAAALVAVAAFALILTGRASLLRWAPLAWLGSISYSLYLIHNLAGRSVILRLEQAGWSADAAILAAIAMIVAAATAINRWVEKPALRAIRDAYRPRSLPAGQPSGFVPTTG